MSKSQKSISEQTVTRATVLGFVRRIYDSHLAKWENVSIESGGFKVPIGVAAYERQLFCTWLEEGDQKKSQWYSDFSVTETPSRLILTTANIGRLVAELIEKPELRNIVRGFFDFYMSASEYRETYARDLRMENLISIIVRASPNYKEIVAESKAAAAKATTETKTKSSVVSDDDQILELTTPAAAKNNKSLTTIDEDDDGTKFAGATMSTSLNDERS